MKVFKLNRYVQVTFPDGATYENKDCPDELWKFISENSDNDDVVRKELLVEEDYKGRELLEKVKRSKVLTLRGSSVYMLDVSELSIPEDFVAKILEAEDKEDEATVAKFRNFWTLVSLNPDSRVRNNLFWFIRKWDMQITDSGLIIAYRNADIKTEAKYDTPIVKEIINRYYQVKYLHKGDPYKLVFIVKGIPRNLGEAYDEIVNGDASPVYTDHRSHKMEIRLGQPVSIPRDECDANQEHSCSKGLHCGAKGWLKKSYYGTVGLMVLVNPAKVVAVPTIDEYGKMRTCEYFPIAIIDFDKNGDIIENPYTLHDDVAYLKQLTYEGTINNEDLDSYEVNVGPRSREEMYEQILRNLNADK